MKFPGSYLALIAVVAPFVWVSCVSNSTIPDAHKSNGGGQHGEHLVEDERSHGGGRTLGTMEPETREPPVMVR